MQTLNLKQAAEYRRHLIARRHKLEFEIEQNVHQLRHDLAPSSLVKEALGLDDAYHEEPTLIERSGTILMDLLVTGLFMRKKSIVKKYLASLVINQVGPAIMALITSKLKDAAVKKPSKNGHFHGNDRLYDQVEFLDFRH